MEAKEKLSKQIITFLIITSVISAGIFVWMFNSSEATMGMIILMMWAPGISALITSLIFQDKIRDYGWKFHRLLK